MPVIRVIILIAAAVLAAAGLFRYAFVNPAGTHKTAENYTLSSFYIHHSDILQPLLDSIKRSRVNRWRSYPMTA